MYIGSLMEKLTPKTNSCCIGSTLPFPVISGESGLQYTWDNLLYTGADLRLSFGETAFCDTILLAFAKAPEYVEILTLENGVESLCSEKLPGKETMEISVAVYAKELIIRMHAALSDIVLTKYDIIGGIFDETPLFPTPHFEALADTFSDLSGGVSFFCCNADAQFAADWLLEFVKTGGSYPIALNMDAVLPEEAFCISVTAEGAQLTASGRRGFLYAVSTLSQMIRNGKLRHGTVSDQPFHEMRGLHFGIPTHENIPFFKRMIRYLLMPMRYNMMIIEVAAGMEFTRHPELNEMWQKMHDKSVAGEWPKCGHTSYVCNGGHLTKAQMRELVEYIESYGIEVVPEVQSLSHVEYLTKAHPEIAEIPEGKQIKRDIDLREEDIPTDEAFYATSFCPSNEASYALLFDVMDEILEVFQPKRYVHMGHDEVYVWGKCAKCKQREPAEILAQDIRRYYDYLTARGLKMMIWGDMVNNINWYAIPSAIDLLPKDILLLDFIWYYKFDCDTEDRLLDHGYDVMIGNLYSSHFPRFESRSRKAHMRGGQVSMWVATDEKVLSYEGKMFDLLMSSQLLCSGSYTRLAHNTYTKILTQRLPMLRSLITSKEGLPSRKGTFTPLALPESTGKLPVRVTAALPKGPVTLKGVPFVLDAPVSVSVPEVCDNAPESITVPLNQFANSLVLLCATPRRARRIAWQTMLPVGECIIRYTDGSEATFALEYGYNIYYAAEKYGTPLAGGYYRHEGYSGTYAIDAAWEGKATDGSDLCLGSYEWVNPHPDKKLAAMQVRAVGDTGVPVWLFGATAVTRN